MSTRQRYKTRQRDLLLQYLESLPGRHITAGDVCAHFERQGMPIGQTTVYRHLEGMVDEGLVQKYVIEAGMPACFEFIGTAHCEGESCFHCKCEKCGRLFHVSGDELKLLQDQLLSAHGFTLDPRRTVFYGLCAACA